MEKVLKRFSKYAYEIIAFLILITHFVFIISFFEPAFSTADANGYFKQAQLIADHGRTWFQAESPIQYVDYQWMEAKGNRFYSRYPPGLPVIIAVLYKLFGPDAGTLINYILTTFTLLGVLVLCSMWIGKGWALVATAVMACNPIINADAVMGYSHAPVAFFLVWGLVFLARWSTNQSVVSAFFAGLLLGIIPTIRYAEAPFGLGIALFILFYLSKNRDAWPSAAAAVIGAAIPILCLMVHNHIAFGAVWKTAYSLTREQTGFSVDYISQNIGPYLKDILLYGAGILWFFGLGGLGMLCVNRDTRKQGLLLIVLVVPTTLLYVSYYFRLENHPFSTMRFLMPTFYIYAIAGVWGLKIVSQRWEKAATAMAITLLFVNTLWGVPQSLMYMILVKDADASVIAVEKVVSENVKPGSLIIAPLHIQQYLDYVERWRLVDDDVIKGLPYALQYIIKTRYKVVDGKIEGLRPYQVSTKSRSEAGSLLAMSFHIERKIKMLPFMPSNNGEVSEKLLNELDRLNSHDNVIYVIGNVEKIKGKIPPNDRLSVIKRIEPPSPLFWKVEKMVPRHPEYLDLLKARLWNGLFFLNEFVVNPLGIIEMMYTGGGLQLIKWTRHINNSSKE